MSKMLWQLDRQTGRFVRKSEDDIRLTIPALEPVKKKLSRGQNDTPFRKKIARGKRDNSHKVPVDAPKTTTYVGVSYDSFNRNWRAYIGINKTTVNLGRHKSEIDAVKARDKYAAKHGRPTQVLHPAQAVNA